MAGFEILAIGLDEADAPARFAKSFRETGFAILKDHNISAEEILISLFILPKKTTIKV